MWHALIWIPLALLIGLWTLLSWGLASLLSAPQGWSSGEPGDWLRWLENWQIPLWLTEWLPMHTITALKAMLVEWGPWLQETLAHAPALLGWLQPLVWGVWGLGLIGLLLLGGVGSVLVAALTRRPQAQVGGTAGPGR
jgi:hypothetical protein